MNPPICNRCKKNVAFIFVSRTEGDHTVNEGYCLKCAKEIGLKPVSDLIDKFGIDDRDIDNLTQALTNGGDMSMLEDLMGKIGDNMPQAFGGMMPMASEAASEPDDPDEGGEDEEDMPSRAPAFPFIFPGMGQTRKDAPRREENEKGPKKNRKKFLPNYAIDLTRRAREGKLDKVIGRDAETERVIQILNRRQKNNPCLIGEPGVGKTAVAEGLAQKIAEGNVPFKLQDKEVWLLDMTAMVAGTQFRGQFESRMKSLIDEVKSLGNIILVIDEVHNLVGAGDAEGSMNAANILKPALSRGEIQVIGATTFKEYRKHIEKDSALERRFQPVTINEPTFEETYDILRGIKGYYEKFHGVTVSDDVLRQAVYLADRYIADRFMPDKAIDLLDEACSDLNLKSPVINERGRLLKETEELERQHEALLTQGDKDEAFYAGIARIKSRQIQIDTRLDELASIPTPALSIDDLSQVIELWTKIPANKIKEQDFERLSKLDARLKERVIGQDQAIEAVAAAIRRRRAGISEKLKPVSFIFVGPTGVGKTELVKCLAADLFDTPDALVRLDMSEYMEKHSVSKLIGAPPGYVGYDEAGQLTEKIRRRPYSVILFDEIEKAHPDVLNILLQMLDDGRVTDAQGRKVSFENAVIIMTSNAGSDKSSGSVGFGRTVTEQGREKALKALSDIMRPEFINRIDEVISFNQLTEGDFARIAGIMLGDLKKAMARNSIALSWDEKLVEFLVKKSYSVKYGARNLRRLIEKEIEDQIANVIIGSLGNPVQTISLSSDGEKVLLEAK